MSEHINVARIKKGEDHFEIDIDPEKAMAFRNGTLTNIHEVLKVAHVYSDVKKGLLASEHAMEKHFKTSDSLEVAAIILQKGEIQVNEEYRRKLRDQKYKQIVQMIHRNGVDPRTHYPHPVTRIENALAEAKVHIDEHQSAEQQLDGVLKKIKPILPIKFEVKEIAVIIPAEYGAKSYGLLKHAGRLLKEEWLGNGSLNVVIEMPGGLEQDFYEKLNAATQGNNTTEVVRIKE